MNVSFQKCFGSSDLEPTHRELKTSLDFTVTNFYMCLWTKGVKWLKIHNVDHRKNEMRPLSTAHPGVKEELTSYFEEG